MTSGLTDKLMNFEDIVALVDAAAPAAFIEIGVAQNCEKPG